MHRFGSVYIYTSLWYDIVYNSICSRLQTFQETERDGRLRSTKPLASPQNSSSAPYGPTCFTDLPSMHWCRTHQGLSFLLHTTNEQAPEFQTSSWMNLVFLCITLSIYVYRYIPRIWINRNYIFFGITSFPRWFPPKHFVGPHCFCAPEGMPGCQRLVEFVVPDHRQFWKKPVYVLA